MKPPRRLRSIIDPAARAVLDRQRDALTETLRCVADPQIRRVTIGALRETERALRLDRADIRQGKDVL
jgi:hypothetical protein